MLARKGCSSAPSKVPGLAGGLSTWGFTTLFRAIAEFLTFRRMIGPFILQLLFWITAVGLVLVGLREISDGRVDQITGIGAMVVGILALRLVLELVLIAFRMYDRLGRIAKLLEAVDEATRPISVIESDRDERD